MLFDCGGYAFSAREFLTLRTNSRQGRGAGRVHIGNHVDPHHKGKHFEAWLEIRSRYYLHSALPAGLAAADDFAHAGDGNRLAWSDLLPAETHRLWRKTFFHLEVPNDEAQRGDASSRAPF